MGPITGPRPDPGARRLNPVIVLGAGVAGVLTAYHLARRGHQVLAVDGAAAPAMGCSHGNAGIIALGHAQAWAGPSAPKSMAQAFLGRDPALRISTFRDPALWRWGLHFLANCTADAHARNSAKLLKLSRYSASLLREIEEREEIGYHQRHAGALYLFKNRRQYEERAALVRNDPAASGIFRLLGVDELLSLEPALRGIAGGLAGGMLSEKDSSGDCRQFTSRLVQSLIADGSAGFRFGCAVTGLRTHGGRIAAVETADGPLSCEAVVVAAGAGTPSIMRKVGISPLIYPVKGYAATYPIIRPDAVPEFPAVDETDLVAFSRFGNRLRLTGIAELAGDDPVIRRDRTEALDAYAAQAFGDAVDIGKAHHWAGLRPSTPSSPPYLGKVRGFENLWINAGHGQLGWTMAAGAGRVLADLMEGRTPEVRGVSARAGWLEAF